MSWTAIKVSFLSFYAHAYFLSYQNETELGQICFVVEGDTGGPVPSPEGYQDALSKKQRRPQEDERRRKEQGATVSSIQHKTSVLCKREVAKPFSLWSDPGEEQDFNIQDSTAFCEEAGDHEHGAAWRNALF